MKIQDHVLSIKKIIPDPNNKLTAKDKESIRLLTRSSRGKFLTFKICHKAWFKAKIETKRINNREIACLTLNLSKMGIKDKS